VLLKVKEVVLVITPSISTCDWFQYYKKDDFDRKRRNIQASQKSLKMKKLSSIKSQVKRKKNLQKSLNVNRSTISRRLKAIGMIQK